MRSLLPRLKICGVLLLAILSLRAATSGVAPHSPLVRVEAAARQSATAQRPNYQITAAVDYDLLTFKSTTLVTVPGAPGDALQDVVFFIYANASGVGGEDERRKNIAVDGVALEGAAVPFTLQGAVLRVQLPQAQSEPFTLKIATHGVVPRSPPGSGSLIDMMGGLSGDIGGMLGGLGGLGGAAGGQESKPKNIDYGLYTYGNGILSLGSFWYPSLAVRQNGRWIGEAPEGLGDLAYSEMSDFTVQFDVSRPVVIAATGAYAIPDTAGATASPPGHHHPIIARNVRDFAVLMSEDYIVKEKPVDVGGKNVAVRAYTTRKHAAKADQAIDIAAHALQVYARRFGPYPYSTFKVVEGPIRGGAGGMEFSGLTSVSSMLYEDMGKQLNALAGELGAGSLDKIMADLEGDMGEAAPPAKNKNRTEPELSDNPASDFLKGMLGQQKQILDSMFEITIAHEVAHQWWAIAVGNDSQRAPFVDESLANYSAIIYFEDRYGREAAARMTELNLKAPYSIGRMLGGADAPVNLKTAAYQNNVQYGAIVYGKGALYYNAVRRAVGDEVFFSSLREYYATYRGRLTGPRDLLEIIKAKAPRANVDALYQRWIEQTHGDEDITGGKAMGIEDLIGGMLGGAAGGGLFGE
ncbi:MAG: hypothetical protein M3347_11330 [Armatimonadota bacterium]|nr:hypothetical protein [Armatimonadota bacterium]